MTHSRQRRALLVLPALLVGFFIPQNARAATAHIVINEVQVGGAAATDEFIELYNPTGTTINLQGWRLSKRTASGSQTNLFTSFPSVSLEAGHYYLITHPTGYAGSVTPDARYSTQESLASNNTVVLFSDAGQTIVDLVGFGTASSFEGTVAANPPSSQSLERNRSDGLVTDSDNNANDFTLLTTPTPMNASTTPAPVAPPPPAEPPPSLPPSDTTPPTAPPSSTPPQDQTPSSPPPLLIHHGDVVINEFVADPTDGEEEWLELVNRSARTFDLTGWRLEDGGHHVTNLSGSLGSVAPNNFSVVLQPIGNLNNTGDRMTIFAPDGTVIDDLSYGDWADGNTADNAPTASDPFSVARTLDGLASGNPAVDLAVTRTPTKGLPNVITTTPTTKNIGPATLRLSELFPNPSGSDAGEFIELTNIGPTDISAIGWRVADASGTDYTIAEKDFGTPHMPAGAYLALPRALTHIALNNSGGETVRLFPPDSTTPIHEVLYAGTAPEAASWADFNGHWQWTTAVTSGMANTLASLNRPPDVAVDVPRSGTAGTAFTVSAEDTTDPEGDSLTLSWSFGDKTELAQGETATHTYANEGMYTIELRVDDGHHAAVVTKRTIAISGSLLAAETDPGFVPPTTMEAPAPVRLSELFPAPRSGKEEWIELTNDGDQPVPLRGWSLRDSSGRTFTLTQESLIAGHGYLTIFHHTSHLSLNNTGDSLTLMSPTRDIVDTTTYDTVPNEKSWASDGVVWGWAITPTPNASNSPLDVSLALPPDARDEPAGDQPLPRGVVRVEGTVVALPKTIRELSFYLNDVRGQGVPKNLRVDFAPTTRVALALGDRLRIQGKLNGTLEPYLRLAATSLIEPLDRAATLPTPTPLDNVILEESIGLLVTTDGTMERSSSTGFTLGLPSGESLRVLLPRNGRGKSTYPVGTPASVDGILGATPSGLRLYVRQPEDVRIIPTPLDTPPTLTEGNLPSLGTYLAITLLGSLSVGGVAFYQWRKSRMKPSFDEAEEEFV